MAYLALPFKSRFKKIKALRLSVISPCFAIATVRGVWMVPQVRTCMLKSVLKVWIRVWNSFTYINENWHPLFELQLSDGLLRDTLSFLWTIHPSQCATAGMWGSVFWSRPALVWKRRDTTVNAAFTKESTSGSTTVINHLVKVAYINNISYIYFESKFRMLSIYRQ